jgi:tRNA modification GTPase
MKLRDDNTIAAIATPIGQGAIAVIRVSGPDAIAISDRVFVGKKRLNDIEANAVQFGKVVDATGRLVDEVLATVFKAPHSYTGEDSVEISCHGGVYVANQILEGLLAGGARQADPGEYTKRAFLNGKMDLSQAEAVADLIQARSEKAHWASVGQLEGKLSGYVGLLRSDLLRLCALLELELDFSEEGIEVVEKGGVKNTILHVQEKVDRMIASYEVGKHYRDGVSVVFAGKPNAGKSSIFNALLKENRAIVSPSPGTTRDYIEEAVVLGGVLFRMIDTAGLREVTELVEAEGVNRAKSKLAESDIVVIVVDAAESLSRADALKALEGLKPIEEIIIAYNKIDLHPDLLPKSIEFSFNGIQGTEVFVSAKTGAGLDLLTTCFMESVADESGVGPMDFRITSRRHCDACDRVTQSLSRALSSVNSGLTNEFIALDVRQAIDALAEITGEITSEDILDELFKEFCIGK